VGFRSTRPKSTIACFTTSSFRCSLWANDVLLLAASIRFVAQSAAGHCDVHIPRCPSTFRRDGNRRCSGAPGPAAPDSIFVASWVGSIWRLRLEMMSFWWRRAERRDRRVISRHGGKLWVKHEGHGLDGLLLSATIILAEWWGTVRRYWQFRPLLRPPLCAVDIRFIVRLCSVFNPFEFRGNYSATWKI